VFGGGKNLGKNGCSATWRRIKAKHSLENDSRGGQGEKNGHGIVTRGPPNEKGAYKKKKAFGELGRNGTLDTFCSGKTAGKNGVSAKPEMKRGKKERCPVINYTALEAYLTRGENLPNAGVGVKLRFAKRKRSEAGRSPKGEAHTTREVRLWCEEKKGSPSKKSTPEKKP